MDGGSDARALRSDWGWSGRKPAGEEEGRQRGKVEGGAGVPEMGGDAGDEAAPEGGGGAWGVAGDGRQAAWKMDGLSVVRSPKTEGPAWKGGQWRKAPGKTLPGGGGRHRREEAGWGGG